MRGARNEEMFQKLLLSGVPSEQFPWICLKYQAYLEKIVNYNNVHYMLAYVS